MIFVSIATTSPDLREVPKLEAQVPLFGGQGDSLESYMSCSLVGE